MCSHLIVTPSSPYTSRTIRSETLCHAPPAASAAPPPAAPPAGRLFVFRGIPQSGRETCLSDRDDGGWLASAAFRRRSSTFS